MMLRVHLRQVPQRRQRILLHPLLGLHRPQRIVDTFEQTSRIR
jgi:hypothetical protein